MQANLDLNKHFKYKEMSSICTSLPKIDYPFLKSWLPCSHKCKFFSKDQSSES